MPINEAEIAQIAQTLAGIVSNRTLLGMLPMVEDVDQEEEQLAKEKQESLANQQAAFGYPTEQQEPDVEEDDEE